LTGSTWSVTVRSLPAAGCRKAWSLANGDARELTCLNILLILILVERTTNPVSGPPGMAEREREGETRGEERESHWDGTDSSVSNATRRRPSIPRLLTRQDNLS
jgi:hypothetical protein